MNSGIAAEGDSALPTLLFGSRHPMRAARRALRCGHRFLVLAALGAATCTSPTSSADSKTLASLPGPGVVFSYPRDGQYDVPVGARVLITFSEALSASAGQSACARDGEQVAGDFCVEGPEGLLSGAPTIEGATLVFAPAGGFSPGATYRVYARPALLPDATNLPAQAPLLTFHARSTRTRVGEAATVLTMNGHPFGSSDSGAMPFLDASPIRLLFSEPLDPTTVTSESARLVHVADSTAVEGVAHAHGIHFTFQPAQSLTAGDGYRLELTDAVLDRGGEPIAPVALELTPVRTAKPDADLVPLSLNVDPAWVDGARQTASRLGAMPVNTNVFTSMLVGANTLNVLPGGLDSLVGDTKALGTTIPMFIPRGQRLDLSSMQIRHGGAVDSGTQTGTTHFTMLTDSVGFLSRNPFRSPDQVPDDAQAPTYVWFMMDAVMSSEDPLGNNVSTQTVMGLELLGLSTAEGSQLTVEQVGTIDYDLLGLETAPVNLAMRLRTGPKAAVPELAAPSLLATFPADGATTASPAGLVELSFSAPLDPALIRDGQEIVLLQGSTAVPTATRLEGTTLVIVPSRRLGDQASVTLRYSGLRSFTGAEVASGQLSFKTAATFGDPASPILVSLDPGAPCALTGGSSTSPGHCAGGKATDTNYLPFTLPANRDIHAVFSLPIDPATVALGTACGKGSLRVETVGAGGTCSGVVSGWLLKGEREVRFTSNEPWTPGAAYRLTLVGGADAKCDAGEICGRNGLPLNTDPFNGLGASAAGGPDVVINFAGAPATQDVYMPLATDPIADLNGNGLLDVGELSNDKNRVAMEITGFGGFITAASLSGSDCLPDRPGMQACQYLSATMSSSFEGVLASCPIDAQGQPSNAPNPCVQVQVYPNFTLGTSTSTTSTISTLLNPITGPITNSDVPTGMAVERLRESDGPIYGYIMEEAGAAVYVIHQNLYFDVPNLSIPLSTTDQKSKPISVTLKGPLTFRPDGRMEVALRNIADVPLQVNITSLLGSGNIDMHIPAGEMRVTLAGPLPR